MYLNKVIIVGNLTRDPERRSLPSGQPVVNFSIATNRVYKDKEGNKQEQTEFHNVVAFGNQADLIGQYVKKGDSLLVEGRIQTRSWDKDGVKQYRTEVVVEQFRFGTSYGKEEKEPVKDLKSEEKAGWGNTEPVQYPDEEINPDDIPF